jgi:AraC-like DNA-binding protein
MQAEEAFMPDNRPIHRGQVLTGGTSDPLAPWLDIIEAGHGLRCEWSRVIPCQIDIASFALGGARLTDAIMSAVSLSPLQWARHEYDHVYVKLVMSGSVMFEQNGERRRFTVGSLIVVDPAVPFVERMDELTRLLVVTCPRSALRERGYLHSFRNPVVADMRSPDVRVVRDIIQLVAERQNELTEKTKAVLGTQLIDLMGVLVVAGEAAVNRSTTAAYYRVKRYIDRHLGNEALDASSIAAGVGLSSGYLNRLFHERGSSLMRYLWSQRLEYAGQLLRDARGGESRISEIAWRCGFTSSAHFSRRFRQQYGTSPKEWRLGANASTNFPERMEPVNDTEGESGKARCSRV